MISHQNGEVPVMLKSEDDSKEMDEKLRQKELELTNEKEEKRKLQEKIKDLERIHVSAEDVHLDKNIKKAIERASIINKEDILH
jgi:hypothetical protein